MPSTGSDPPFKRRRRRRPARSCEQCRRRKIRCTQDQPCGGCVRARAPMQCTYRDGSPVDTPRVVEKPPDLPPLDPRPRTESETSHCNSSALGRGPVVSYPREQRHLSAEKRDLPVEPQPEPIHTSRPIQHFSPSFLRSSSSIPPITPRLRNVPEKTKLFGQTHWLHTAEKFPVSGRFHPIEVEPNFNDAKAELLEAFSDARNLRFAMKALHRVKLEEPLREICTTLPSPEVCTNLVRCYFRTLEPLYRIIHIPTFWKDYNRVWDISADNFPLPRVFMIKLSLILSIGTTFYKTGDNDEMKTLHQLAQTWIQNAQWWLTGPSEKNTYTLEGLQVFCLLLLARQTTFNCNGATSWLSAGSLLRMAITMGLHRNPKLFPTLTPCHRELRARLWATVLELSVQSCLDLALPLNFTPDEYDANLPLNYNDADISSANPNSPAPMSTCTDSSLQILLAKSLPLRMEIVRFLNDFKNEQSYEKALALGGEIRTACREIAAFFHSHTEREGEDSPDDNERLKFRDFHRKFMDIHLRRFTMFLHRDFMLQARTDPRFYLSRKTCVEAAMVIASSSKGEDLTLPINEWDDMARLSLVGRGLFKCSFSFDAILILSLEVVTQLDEESAPQNEADPLDEIAKATRTPLILTLECIRDQLTQQIIRGNTSLKRLLFVEAHLTQIRAMESGQPIKSAVYETVNKTLRTCLTIMRENQQAATPQECMETTDTTGAELLPFDMLLDGTDMNWDISNLLCFSALNDATQLQWPS